MNGTIRRCIDIRYSLPVNGATTRNRNTRK
jgi:hypothetical protein